MARIGSDLILKTLNAVISYPNRNSLRISKLAKITYCYILKILFRLGESELVTYTTKNNRKFYKITDKGLEVKRGLDIAYSHFNFQYNGHKVNDDR